MRAIAALYVSEGYSAVGYEYFNLDDCWQVSRDANGVIVPDPKVFPNGIQPFIAYIKSLNLKFGVYTDAGTATCGGRPGSLGHETTDAQTYASWGVDFVKVDNCNDNGEDAIARYTAFGKALNGTGKPIYFSACIWGVSQPWTWMQPLANSWRTDDDIFSTWDSLNRVLANQHGLSQYAGPYAGWNDLDMLETGNFNDYTGKKDETGRLHFALWALYKSQLIIGTDLRKASAATKATLQAVEVIAVNQDPLGVAGDLLWQEGPARVYAGPLADGSRAVVMGNFHHYGSQYPNISVTVQFSDLGYGQHTAASVRDLYVQQDLGVFTGSFTGAVNLHDCLALKVTPVAEADRDTLWRPWARVR